MGGGGGGGSEMPPISHPDREGRLCLPHIPRLPHSVDYRLDSLDSRD